MLSIFFLLIAAVLSVDAEAPDTVLNQKKTNCQVIAKWLEKVENKFEKQSEKFITSPPPSALNPQSLPDCNTKLYKEEKENSGNPTTYFLFGCAYAKLHMYKKAIKVYKQALLINPDFVEAYVNLGIAYYKLGDYLGAIDAFQQAIKREPNSLSLYNKLGSTYIAHSAYSMAIETFKRAIGIEPKNADAHFNLGITYFLNGDTTAAFREYRILKDIDKERANSLIDLIY